MVDVVGAIDAFLVSVFAALPAVIGAIIVLIIGYLVGVVLGRAVNRLIEQMGLERAFERNATGKAFKSAGLDLSSFVGAVIEAFVFILALSYAVQILSLSGVVGTYLVEVANYLPKLLGGILVIVLGSVLVDFLATLVGTIMRPIFPSDKGEIVDALRNLLGIGLIAFVLQIGLNLMLLDVGLIFPLIIGFVLIAAGIALTDGLIKSITDDYPDFKSVAGYAKFVLYSAFLLIGAAAIIAQFSAAVSVVATLSWAFAIALAIMLIPVVYAITRKAVKETG